MSQLKHIPILVVCALHAEAKSLIRELKLEQQISQYGFSFYQDKEAQIGLLITGVGKIKMAAALMWINNQYKFSSYLNVGVMGHGSATLGTGLVVNKVIDSGQGKPFYPIKTFKSPISTTTLITVEQPSDDYESGFGYDMEASAFVTVARLFVTAELVHIYKVVSDNSEDHFEKITSKKVIELINQNITDICHIITELTQLGELVRIDATEITEMAKRWHITVSQKQQLMTAIESQLALQSQCSVIAPKWQSFSSAKEYLCAMNKWVESVAPENLSSSK